MGFLSQRVERSDLEAGDHIYTWRSAFLYSHHGIYVGKDKVVHFTQDQKSSPSALPTISSSLLNVSATCLDLPECGFGKHRSGVTISCLNCFLGNGFLFRFEYGVNGFAFIAKVRGGTCTTAKSDPREAVIHRAMQLLQNGFGNYDLFTNNCEDFALYCKTGLLACSKERRGGSGQASSLFGFPVATILSLPLRIFVSSPVFLGTTAVNYALTKYASDIGVRSDVIKVKVEDIDVYHGDQSGDRDAWPDGVGVTTNGFKGKVEDIDVYHGDQSGDRDAWPDEVGVAINGFKVKVEDIDVYHGNQSGDRDVWPDGVGVTMNSFKVKVDDIDVYHGNQSGDRDAWPDEVGVTMNGPESGRDFSLFVKDQIVAT